MYDLDTRGQLVLADYNFRLVRVLAEDVSIREAFDIANSHSGEGTIFFAPVGESFVDGVWGPLMYQVDADIGRPHPTEDHRWTTGDVAHFTWGEELEDQSVHGFAMAVWEDGLGPRRWYPAD